MIELPPLASPVDQLWHALLDLSDRLTVPWTLVGGQMVLLHALEHGQAPLSLARTATSSPTSAPTTGPSFRPSASCTHSASHSTASAQMASPTATHARQSLGPS